MDQAVELAAFLADNPDLLGEELASVVQQRWGSLTRDEADQAIAIFGQLREARESVAKTELHRLVEWTRILHGTLVAASILYRYRSALEDQACLAA